MARVAEGTSEDALAAIAAARAAFDTGPWPHTTEGERAALLDRLADVLERDAKEFARAESLDTGKRLVESEYDLADIIGCFRYFAGIGGTEAGRVVDTGRSDAISRIVYDPVGVCALITPWNYPLLQTSWKVAPALLAGNTFVLKPSELTPVDRGAADARAAGGRPARRRRQPRPRGRLRSSVRRWPTTRASTWCRSPAGWRPASTSPPRPRPA